MAISTVLCMKMAHYVTALGRVHNLERTDDPPIACSIIALIAIYEPIYYVLPALRNFLADPPGEKLCAPNRHPQTRSEERRVGKECA